MHLFHRARSKHSSIDSAKTPCPSRWTSVHWRRRAFSWFRPNATMALPSAPAMTSAFTWVRKHPLINTPHTLTHTIHQQTAAHSIPHHPPPPLPLWTNQPKQAHHTESTLRERQRTAAGAGAVIPLHSNNIQLNALPLLTDARPPYNNMTTPRAAQQAIRTTTDRLAAAWSSWAYVSSTKLRPASVARPNWRAPWMHRRRITWPPCWCRKRCGYAWRRRLWRRRRRCRRCRQTILPLRLLLPLMMLLLLPLLVDRITTAPRPVNSAIIAAKAGPARIVPLADWTAEKRSRWMATKAAAAPMEPHNLGSM